jgi:tetratricopeptide (TPR) repeat protein
MSLSLCCPQGHVWDHTSDVTLMPDSLPPCPVCGSALHHPASQPPAGGTLHTFEAPLERPASTSGTPKPLPPRAPSRPSVTLPGYEMLEELGRGGMGVVLKARHVALKRLVALKMILGGDLAGARELLRFRKEAEAVARLQHPNIVQVFDVGEHEGHPYFSLELVEGGTLAARLQKSGPLEPRAAAGLMETLTRAVHYAHERGVVHRDLKPANILLAKDGTPKITDFGLAKQMDQGDQTTRTGVIAGTPAYMAPEQATGRSDLFGPRTDVWALGMILYELLTGKLPFSGTDSMDVIFRVVNNEPASPRSFVRSLPRDLEVITLKCLNKDLGRRYGSALELADDLRRFLDHVPIRARPTSAGERIVRWIRRRPAIAALTAGLLVTAAAWGAVVSARYRDQQAQHAADVADAGAFLERTRGAVGQADWDRAAELLTDFAAASDSSQLPADMRADATRLNAGVQRHLEARATYRQFVVQRDEALFQAAPGVTPAVREKAAHAVEFVGYRPADSWLPGEEFSDMQAVDILCGVYELLELTAPEAIAAGKVRDAARRSADALGRQRTGADKRAFAGLELYLTGLDHFQRGRHTAALESFSAALLAQPDRYWARYYQALCYARLGHRPELVRDALTVCLAQRSDVVWPYLQRGFAHAQLGLYDSADADFREAERLLGDRPDPEARYVLLNNRAVARVGQGRIESAFADLDRAVGVKPEMYHAYVTRAQAFHLKNDTGRALASLDEALTRAERSVKDGQVSPETLSLLYRTRAHWQIERKDPAAALRDLDRAAAVEPDKATRARLLRDKAQLLAREGHFKEAVAAFEATLQLTPRDGDVLLARAECLLNLGRFEDAEEGFTRAIAASPRPAAKALANRAVARLRRQKPDARGALVDLTLALELEPEKVAWRLQRGQAALLAEDFATAVGDFSVVLSKNADNSAARFMRSQALLKLGKFDDAARDAEGALRAGGLKPSQKYSAATVLARAAGQLDRAADRNRRAADQRARYQSQAIEALTQLLTALPREERATFWRDFPARDAALSSVRTSDDFRRLEREFAAQPETR